jgi:hypothetical protein
VRVIWSNCLIRSRDQREFTDASSVENVRPQPEIPHQLGGKMTQTGKDSVAHKGWARA